MSNRLLPLKRIFTLAATASILLFSTNVNAAERAVFKYRILRQSVSVPELARFAETGEVSTTVGAYIRMAGQAPEQVRQPLTREIKVNPLLLYRVLNSRVGDVVLDKMSEVIHTPDKVGSRQALRAAIMTSALSNNQITLIEVLQNYPTQDVHIDGDRLVELYNQLSALAGRLPINLNLPF